MGEHAPAGFGGGLGLQEGRIGDHAGGGAHAVERQGADGGGQAPGGGQDEVNRAAEQERTEHQRWPAGVAGQPGEQNGPHGGPGADGAQQQPESGRAGVQGPFGQDDEQGAGGPSGQRGQELDQREQPQQRVTDQQAAAFVDTASPRPGGGRSRDMGQPQPGQGKRGGGESGRVEEERWSRAPGGDDGTGERGERDLGYDRGRPQAAAGGDQLVLAHDRWQDRSGRGVEEPPASRQHERDRIDGGQVMAGQRQQRGQAGAPPVGSDHHADTGQPVSYR